MFFVKDPLLVGKWLVQQANWQCGGHGGQCVNKVLWHFSVTTSKWEYSHSFHTKNTTTGSELHSKYSFKYQTSITYILFLWKIVYLQCTDLHTYTHMHTSIINCKAIKCTQSHILVPEETRCHTQMHYSWLHTDTHRHCIIRHKDTNIGPNLISYVTYIISVLEKALPKERLKSDPQKAPILFYSLQGSY